jgi:hypothetical protein
MSDLDKNGVAFAAFGRGDFATAMNLWLPMADRGNAYAQNNLGAMYQCGQGVLQDYRQAVAWYRKAADQGYAPAQYNLGVMYGKGRGVPQDDQQTLIWLRKAADQGNADAQFALGLIEAADKRKAKRGLVLFWVFLGVVVLLAIGAIFGSHGGGSSENCPDSGRYGEYSSCD